jgi:hypothetical protein
VAVSLGTAQPPAAVPAADGWGMSAFGLEVRTDFPLPGARRLGGAEPGEDLALRLVPADSLDPYLAEPRILRLLHAFGDCPYAMLEGTAGDILVCYGYRGLFHLSADGRELLCGPTDPADVHWQRELLDTMLWTVSLIRGFELLHASAVDTPAGVIAFVAESGGGKSTMAAEYLRRGHALFSDDMVALEERAGELLAHPGPRVMNLPGRVDPAEVGATAIAAIGDERWVELSGPAPPARPLAAVVLVDRAPGNEARCTPIDGTSLKLLPYAVGLPYVEGGSRRRFELFGRVAAATPLLHLTADLSVPAGAMADLVDARIAAE